MISTQNVTLAFGQRVLFSDVTLKFLPGKLVRDRQTMRLLPSARRPF